MVNLLDPNIESPWPRVLWPSIYHNRNALGISDLLLMLIYNNDSSLASFFITLYADHPPTNFAIDGSSVSFNLQEY